MGRTIQERLGVIQNDNKKYTEGKNDENRRIRKLEKQIKKVRRIIVHQINCTEKILNEKLQRKRRKHNANCKKAENQSDMNEELLQLIGKRLEELQFKKVILERIKTRDAKT